MKIKISKSTLKRVIKELVMEAFSNKFGEGGNLPEAERVASSVWGNVFLVMPKGEENSNVYYRVTLSNSNGAIKYLRQDINGKWYKMDPPQQIWKSVNPDQTTKECDCAPGCNCDANKDSMQGDVEDVRTMDTANLEENNKPTGKVTGPHNIYVKSGPDAGKYFLARKEENTGLYWVMNRDTGTEYPIGKEGDSIDVQKIYEMTSSGAVFSGGPTIQTPYAFSKRGSGSKKAMDATKSLGYKLAKKEF